MENNKDLLQIIIKLQQENATLRDDLSCSTNENISLQNSISELNQTHASKVDELNQKHASKVDELNQKHASKVDELNQKHANEKAKLHNELHKLNQKLNKLLLENKAFQDKYKAERIKIFIPKNEKLDNIVINEVEEVEKAEKNKRTSNLGKKYNKDTFDYEQFVTETRIIEPSERVCLTCNSELVFANEKVRYEIEVIPSQIKVVKVIKQSKKCPKCSKIDNRLYYPLNKSIDGSLLTPSLASYIAYCKYELGIPFNHLEKHFKNTIGFEIPKQNLSNYMIKTASILTPIFNRMKSDLLNSKVAVIHSDETTLVVTKPDATDRKNSYVYSYTSSFYDPKQIRIYDFHESRSIEPTTKWLKDYNGTIVCDSFAGYNKLAKENPNIQLQKCWAHVRRKFADIVKGLKPKELSVSIAQKILLAISKIFEKEQKYKKLNYFGENLLKVRQKDMPNIKAEIETLVFNCNPQPKSLLETAINYTKNCWNELFTFLNNPFVEPTNNTAERAIKPFVIARKVFQTSGSNAGAECTTKLFSMIQTCNINNINVEKYISYALENIDSVPLENLLPYSENIKDKFFCNPKAK